MFSVNLQALLGNLQQGQPTQESDSSNEIVKPNIKLFKDAVQDSNGNLYLDDGIEKIQVKDILEDADGFKIAQMMDDQLVGFDFEEEEKSTFETYFSDPIKRSLGIVFGGLNAGMAGVAGAMKAGAESQNPIWHPQYYKDWITGGLTSAYRSAARKGDWGDNFQDVCKAVTGKDIKEHTDMLFNVEKDPAKKAKFNEVRKFLSEATSGTIELTLAILTDPLVTVPMAMQHFQKAIPKLNALDPQQAKVLKKITDREDNVQKLIDVLHEHQVAKAIKDTQSFMQEKMALEQARIQGDIGFFNSVQKLRKVQELAAGTQLPVKKINTIEELTKQVQETTQAVKPTPAIIYGQPVELPKTVIKPESFTEIGTYVDDYLSSFSYKSPEQLAAQHSKDLQEVDKELLKTIPLGKLDTRPHVQEAMQDLEKTTQELLTDGSLNVFDSFGFQQIYESIKSKVSKSKDLPIKQASDVIPLVKNFLRPLYEDFQVVPSTWESLTEAAQDLGGSLAISTKGAKRKFKLTLEDGTTIKTKNPDEIVQKLGLCDTIDEYKAAMVDMELEKATEQGVTDFMRDYFPKGLKNVSKEDAYQAMTKFMQKSFNRERVLKAGDRKIKAAEVVLGRTPAGKSFFRTMRDMKDDSEATFADRYFGIERIIKDLDDDTLEEVRLVLDGYEDKVINPQAIRTAEQIRPYLDDAYNDAKYAGIDVMPYREKYWPHLPIKDLKKLKAGKLRQDILNACVREGRFKGIEEAEEKLDSFIKRLEGNRTEFGFIKWLAEKKNITEAAAVEYFNKKIAPHYTQVSQHLTKGRFVDMPFYSRDFRTATANYLWDTSRNAAVYKHLGKGNAKGYRMINRLAAEGGNREYATEFMLRFTNPVDFPGPDGLAADMMAVQAITKLGFLTTLVNLTQPLAAGLKTDTFSLIRGIRNYDRAAAEECGAVLNQVLRDVMQTYGASDTRVLPKLAGAYLKGIFFMGSEGVVRTVAANTGKVHAMKLFNWYKQGKRTAYVKRWFESVGMNSEKVLAQDSLTDTQLKMIMKRVSDATQFRGDAFSVPLDFLGPNGRFVTQFKTFLYEQAVLVKKAVYDEAKKGNFRPALFLATVYPAVGSVKTGIIDPLILGKEPPKDFADWYFRSISAVGALGMFMASLDAAKFGVQGLLEFGVGPNYSDLVRLLHTGLTGNIEAGKVGEAAARRIPGIGQIVGPRIHQANKKNQGKSINRSFRLHQKGKKTYEE